MSQSFTWSLQQVVDGVPSCVYAIPNLPLISIGSSPASNLVLDDVDISSLHAVLVCEDNDTLTISSQSQAGGVWVNDQMVTEQELRNGDSLRLGGMTFQVIGHALQVSPIADLVTPRKDLAGNRPKRRAAMFAGAVFMLLVALGWIVYQDLDTKSKHRAAAVRRASLASQVKTLQWSFAQGDDVILPASGLTDHADFRALPEHDRLREQLYQLIQQLQASQELRTQIATLSQQQLALKPADDAKLAVIKQGLASQPLPQVIQQELTKEVELLLAEQQGMRKVFAVRDKGVAEQRRREEKLELEAVVNKLARAEVRVGLQKVVEQLFPKAVEVETKPAPRPLPQEKPEPPPFRNIQQP